MADPCDRRSSLTRAGLTQAGRHLPELARDHFVPDERDLADLVLFGQRFAAHLQFYDAKNAKDGDWRAFFESDLTAALAALAKLPVEPFRQFQGDLDLWLRADPARDPVQLGTHFRLWFHLPLALLEIVGKHHASLPSDHALAQSIPRLVARDLAAPLASFAGWYKGALDDGAGGGADLFADLALNPDDFNIEGGIDSRIRLSSTVAEAVFGRPAFSALLVPKGLLTRVPPGHWPGIYNAATADMAPYADAAAPYPRIYDALTYNLLTRAAERIMQAFLRLRQDAEAALGESLTEFANHPAHYGLWLAFLKMFRLAQNEMNAFTGRHMDFYFREVLGLVPRAAAPDHAHLTFALAKGTERQLLSKGTAFRAGKDATGVPVTFTLDDDLVINRGVVAQLTGVRLETGVASGQPTLLVRAASVVNSADGLGAVELPEDAPTFPPFGPIQSPPGRVGFAVADRRLFLREGSRSFVLRAELRQSADETLAPRFTVRLTGDKGWFQAGSVTARIDNTVSEQIAGKSGLVSVEPGAKGSKTTFDLRANSGFEKVSKGGAGKPQKPGRKPETRIIRVLEITVTLGPTDPPVVPFDSKLHGTEHAPGVPVAEVVLDFASDASCRAYAALKDIRVDRVSILARATGVKSLSILAAGATADPAKPFAPFGPRPRTGDTLIIGSSEIFSKKIAALTLTLDWLTPHSSTGFYRALSASDVRPTETVLSDGVWSSSGSKGRTQGTEIGLGKIGAEIDLQSVDEIDGTAAQTIDNPDYDTAAVTGFLKLRLDEDFGHHAQPTEMARAMVSLARNTSHTPKAGVNYDPAATAATVGILPRAPYDPVISRIEASYETVRSRVAALSLLAPFGIEPSGGRLFPDLSFAGALYVGIANFVPPAKLTLLIAVEDGSGDPLLPVPDLEFAWLDGDHFVRFDAQDVDDTTLNFTTSGIVGLALPLRAAGSHRAMPDGLVWIRIAAPHYPEALNRLRSVTAQAGRATFADQGNDPARLAVPVPPGTITKLLIPEPAVKTVAQPYESFGGRAVETPVMMDVRAAERLRHKDRAVTMWDTEALVLEAFPNLYRVKCLNLTALQRNTAGVVIADNEQQPGAVSVVTVPVINVESARDPLRPYTDQATLAAVDQFLRPRFSPFVRLEVTNPKIEEVQLDFQVRFAPGIADIAFYIDQLNAALIGYLTPWATAGGGEITFGGKFWRSRAIDFLDERPEVDFVTEVKMYHKVDITAPPGGWTPIPLEVIEATSARSILVSAPQHVIVEVSTNG